MCKITQKHVPKMCKITHFWHLSFDEHSSAFGRLARKTLLFCVIKITLVRYKTPHGIRVIYAFRVE